MIEIQVQNVSEKVSRHAFVLVEIPLLTLQVARSVFYPNVNETIQPFLRCIDSCHMSIVNFGSNLKTEFLTAV